ncbi:hypothetical protein [Chromohalobacter israelensis]|uniref:hypothetical protein n=1 Tax=Chromohalobacter israelensis TaxID=141390 RepID=UPI000D71AA27|nr:hypothetical protein [Chromohalobacter salexigens]PWW42797.1 hypothetical protein DFO74_101154 [Chromohalobacter salexigens]
MAGAFDNVPPPPSVRVERDALELAVFDDRHRVAHLDADSPAPGADAPQACCMAGPTSSVAHLGCRREETV